MMMMYIPKGQHIPAACDTHENTWTHCFLYKPSHGTGSTGKLISCYISVV